MPAPRIPPDRAGGLEWHAVRLPPGSHYQVDGATVRRCPTPVPPVFFGGASPARRGRRARAPSSLPAVGRDAAAGHRAAAADAGARRRGGRDVRFPHPAARHRRHTEGRGWQEAERLLAAMEPAAIAAASAASPPASRSGQRRMAALSGGRQGGEPRTPDVRSLEVAPNLWAGIGLVRVRRGPRRSSASHEQLADRHRGVPRPRRRPLHPVRLSAPGGGVTGSAKASVRYCRRRGLLANEPDGPAPLRADRLTARPMRRGARKMTISDERTADDARFGRDDTGGRRGP